jgi:hypothetical protein
MSPLNIIKTLFEYFFRIRRQCRAGAIEISSTIQRGLALAQSAAANGALTMNTKKAAHRCAAQVQRGIRGDYEEAVA